MNIRTSIGESKHKKYNVSSEDVMIDIGLKKYTFWKGNVRSPIDKNMIISKLSQISDISTNLDIDEIFNWLYADKSLSRFSDYINHFNDIHHTHNRGKSAKYRYHRKMCIYD